VKEEGKQVNDKEYDWLLKGTGSNSECGR